METFFQEHILLAGHRKHPVTQEFLRMQEAGEVPDLSLLEKERVILLRPEFMLAQRVNNYLDKKQVILQNTVYTTNASTALNLTAENYGFCFVNETGIHSAPHQEDLAFFYFDTEDMVHPLSAVYKKKSYLIPAARRFIDLMLEYYKSLSHGHEAPR